MTTDTRKQANFRRFLNDIRKTPQQRADGDAVQDLMDGVETTQDDVFMAVPEEGEPTFTYRRMVVDIKRYPSGVGCDVEYCQTDDGMWWMRYDGATAWDEVEGPR